jgi:hypothetical protein
VSRNLPVRDEQRLQAAVARGALTPARAEHWRVYAAAGHSIEFIDQLVGGVVAPMAGPSAAAAARGTVAAAAARGPAQPKPDEDGLDAYHALFGSRADGERTADAREVAARAAVASLTDDQVYETMFGKGTAAPAPVAASAAWPTGQPGQGEAARKQWRVHVPRLSLRVPRDPDVAAGADPGKTSWKTIYLYGGDLVPQNAHPEDVARLRQERDAPGRGPKIKAW